MQADVSKEVVSHVARRTPIRPRPPVYSPERSHEMAFRQSPKAPQNRRNMPPSPGWNQHVTKLSDSAEESDGEEYGIGGLSEEEGPHSCKSKSRRYGSRQNVDYKCDPPSYGSERRIFNKSIGSSGSSPEKLPYVPECYNPTENLGERNAGGDHMKKNFHTSYTSSPQTAQSKVFNKSTGSWGSSPEKLPYVPESYNPTETLVMRNTGGDNMKKQFRSFDNGSETSSKQYFSYVVMVCIACVAIACVPIAYDAIINALDSSEISYPFQKLKADIEDLKTEFPSQDKKIWNHFLSGIKTITTEDPTAPSVFLLLYKSGDEDKRTSECLAKKIGGQAGQFLSQSVRGPLILKGRELQNSSFTEDYGRFLDAYKDEIELRQVMILYNLQDIPANVVPSFHPLCDRENPLIERAAYLFTLQVQGKTKGMKPTAIAEETLRSLWEVSLGRDIAEPLITRITDTVLSVTSERNLPCI